MSEKYWEAEQGKPPQGGSSTALPKEPCSEPKRPLAVGDVVRLKCDDGAYPVKMVLEALVTMSDGMVPGAYCDWMNKRREKQSQWFALTSLVRVDDE